MREEGPRRPLAAKANALERGRPEDPRTDEELLASTTADPEAFGWFYRRYRRPVLQFFLARLREPELAADLTAEVFAAALVASRRYEPGRVSARSWLYAIAQHKLVDSLRRGRVADKARRKLEMGPVGLEDEDLARIEELAGLPLPPGGALELLADLPKDMREALTARIFDEREYGEIARELQCSELVVRKRVSRGLSRLRERFEEER